MTNYQDVIVPNLCEGYITDSTARAGLRRNHGYCRTFLFLCLNCKTEYACLSDEFRSCLPQASTVADEILWFWRRFLVFLHLLRTLNGCIQPVEKKIKKWKNSSETPGFSRILYGCLLGFFPSVFSPALIVLWTLVPASAALSSGVLSFFPSGEKYSGAENR